MKAKDNRETNDQGIVIEDLSVENAEVIKSRSYKIVMQDCLVSNWQS
jgi:hypothetical protein